MLAIPRKPMMGEVWCCRDGSTFEPSQLLVLGSEWNDLTKFDSQGVAWSGRLDASIVFNSSGTLRPEISFYRGSRAFPEGAIRQHTTADTGIEVWIGNGTVAPTRVAQFLSTGMSITGSLTTSAGITITTGGLSVTAGGITVTAGGMTISLGGLNVSSGTTSVTTLNCGQVVLSNARTTQDVSQSSPTIYGTGNSGGAYPFLESGNLVISPRISGATRDLLIWNASGGTPTAVFFRSGRVAIGSTTDDGSNALQVTGSATFSSSISVTGSATLSGELILGNSQAALDTAQVKPILYGTNGGGGSYPFNGAGHLIISSRLSGASRDVLVYANTTAPTAIFFNSGRCSIGPALTDDGLRMLQVSETKTISGTLTDGYAAGAVLTPTYSAATSQTVTRHNYVLYAQPVSAGAGGTTVTDACVAAYDAAAGTHKAVDGATTKTTPTAVDAWEKVNVNGAIRYRPLYASKTA